MTDTKNKPLNFRISSALKDIVGRDLITDNSVAIFELVKNSFDALASRVDIIFEDNAIYIVDDGKGMTEQELEEKWLFLGYSGKLDGSEEITIKDLEGISDDFRNRIKNHKAGFAGNKGIGRFSCDRLGVDLKLSTRSVDNIKGPVSHLNVSWKAFEKDAKKEFIDIPVEFSALNSVDLPKPLKGKLRHGTILEISKCRSKWTRDKILKLKASLAKLINPFGVKDELEIYIHAEKELAQDKKAQASEQMSLALQELTDEHFSNKTEAAKHIPTHYKDIVNGKVQNFVFQKIANNTTNVEVSLINGGEEISSKLYDRGELILEIEEKNPFKHLKNTEIDVELHSLNSAAKNIFTRYMGLQSVNFGSIFLFHNGFRVFPIGEPGIDTFGLDQRKSQGYNRYLGSRELVGRININTYDPQKFKEASSRNAGLIVTPAYNDLEKFLIDKCVKFLERYVVNVSWVDKLDKDQLDLSRMKTDSAKARIIDVVSKMVKNPDVKLISYSSNLLSLIDEKSSDFSKALDGLELVAEKLGNKSLLKELSSAKKQHAELVEAQKKAQEEADAERQAKEEAEEKAKKEQEAKEKAEARADEAEEKAKDAEKRIQFFTALDNEDYQSLVDYHHQIGVYSSEIDNHIALARKKFAKDNKLSVDDTKLLMERVEYANAKIQSIVNFATKANFMLDGEETTADLSVFIPDYINKICTAFAGTGLDLIFEGEASKFELKFKPIELSMAIDNLVHNSRKAQARKVWFNLSNPEKGRLLLEVRDNAPKGLSPKIKDPQTIFEKGVTTTSGSGLGLYYAKQIISEMGGNIDVQVEKNKTLTFKIEFAK